MAMEKCRTCQNYDRKRSTHNWTVCPVIPLDVIISGDSSNCSEYVEMEDEEEPESK